MRSKGIKCRGSGGQGFYIGGTKLALFKCVNKLIIQNN